MCCSLKRSRAELEEDDHHASSPSSQSDNQSDTSSRGLDHELVYSGSLDLALSNKRRRPAEPDDLSLPPPTPSLSPANAMDVDDPPSKSPSPRPSSELADWQALKAQHASAMQLFDGEAPASAAPVLRRVLNECERILTLHRDPSVIYSPSLLYTPPSTPPQPAGSFDMDIKIRQSSPSALQLEFLPQSPSPLPQQQREPVIAFYALYGAALFAFGSLIARDPTLVTPQDVPSAGFYFGRALDVLDYGENHPRRTISASDSDSRAENFELAITYGRTLLYLAAEHVRVDIELTVNAAPLWPADSPFAPAQLPIPPRRLSLPALGAPGILALAADQLLRAFLHMPHSGYTSSSVSAASSSMRRCHPLFKTCACPRHVPERERPFPRCRTLNSVGHDVLRIAGSLPNPEDRKKWALWADGNAFGQMRWEPEAGGWETVRELARGRCRLLASRACVGEVQAGLHAGGIAHTVPDLTEGLDHVQKAIEHLSRAALPGSHPTTQQEARSLLADAQRLLSVSKPSADVGVDSFQATVVQQLDQSIVVSARPNTQIPSALAIFASG